jgi:hypothetical protein
MVFALAPRTLTPTAHNRIWWCPFSSGASSPSSFFLLDSFAPYSVVIQFGRTQSARSSNSLLQWWMVHVCPIWLIRSLSITREIGKCHKYFQSNKLPSLVHVWNKLSSITHRRFVSLQRTAEGTWLLYCTRTSAAAAVTYTETQSHKLLCVELLHPTSAETIFTS